MPRTLAPALSWRRATTGGACWTVLAVLLLVSFSYTAAVLGPAGSIGEGGGTLGLHEVELEVRSLVSEALDASLVRAVEVAAVEDDIDLTEALDASLVPRLARWFPLEVGGWRVELLAATASMDVVGASLADEWGMNGARAPTAVALVSVAGSTRHRTAFDCM